VRSGLTGWVGDLGAAFSVEAYRDALVRTGFVNPEVRVVRRFGLDDIALLEETSLGRGFASSVPAEDLIVADGLIAAVHVTAASPGREF